VATAAKHMVLAAVPGCILPRCVPLVMPALLAGIMCILQESLLAVVYIPRNPSRDVRCSGLCLASNAVAGGLCTSQRAAPPDWLSMVRWGGLGGWGGAAGCEGNRTGQLTGKVGCTVVGRLLIIRAALWRTMCMLLYMCTHSQGVLATRQQAGCFWQSAWSVLLAAPVVLHCDGTCTAS
jgi:hypothetical protein